MRVISQDGCYDYNYDGTGLFVADSGSIFAYSDFANACPFAKYSSREKALKVMDQLRDSYMNREYCLSIISGAVNIVPPKKEEREDFHKLLETARSSCVFRFPADNDLEE